MKSIIIYPIFAISLSLMSCSFAYADSWPITVKVGVGKASADASFDTEALIAKGYNFNSYSQQEVDKSSNNYGFSVRFSPNWDAELVWQGMGKVRSALDVTLPIGITVQQAAEDIVSASPQQAGGAFVGLGVNYIRPISSYFDFRAGAGFLTGSDEHRIRINGEEIDIRNSSTAPYLKLGVGANVGKGFRVTAHAERYFFDESMDRYEIGLSYSLE